MERKSFLPAAMGICLRLVYDVTLFQRLHYANFYLCYLLAISLSFA